jgi:hypothetical protein
MQVVRDEQLRRPGNVSNTGPNAAEQGAIKQNDVRLTAKVEHRLVAGKLKDRALASQIINPNLRIL